jgi:signal transduction histidine kinase
VGPRVPDPFYAAGVLLFLVPSLLVQAQLSRGAARMLDGMIQQVARAREQIATQALTRARELELLGSKLTHELKNPLGAAKALVQLSARTTPDRATREELAVVEGEVGRIQSILQEYLSFSRPFSSLERRPVQLSALVDDVLAAAARRAEAAGVLLERRGDARASADARRLTEALLNLVANAIDASPAQRQVEVEITSRDDRVEIAVRDAGAGMPPEVLARVGTPFFTTRPHGIGLGVLLARGVFAQHGGSLAFESEPGRGTTAIGSFPAGLPQDPDRLDAAVR